MRTLAAAHCPGHAEGMTAQDAAGTMAAWRVVAPGPVSGTPLRWERSAIPEPGSGEVLVRVLACGVCRTDLHVTEGDLPVHRPRVIPGHEVVGEVVALGDSVSGRFSLGDRVGIAWLRFTCGRCAACLRGAENLCRHSQYTGWDADGGYAEFATVSEDYALRLPDGYTDEELAPLLCAGIIGYRALERAAVPEGGSLGIYGFGGSAHLTAQVALARGVRVHVMTRGEDARALARQLGAASVQGVRDVPPELLDSAILFAPVGDLVPVAMESLSDGGTLAIAGIHLTDIPSLEYQKHLFRERQIRSVTANTRADSVAFLQFAAEHRMHIDTHVYSLDEADQALRDLSAGRFSGAAVLQP